MITEAELIEIATRRRKLEDAHEETKSHIGAARKRAEKTLEQLHNDAGDYLTPSEAKELNRLEKLVEHLEELPDNIDKLTEACRDDMNRMEQELRDAGVVK